MNPIEQYRKEQDITQGELAQLIGRTQAVISYYESGDKRPNGSTLNRLRKLDPDFFTSEIISRLATD